MAPQRVVDGLDRVARPDLAGTGAQLPVVAIGPQTEAEARAYGLEIAAVAPSHDLGGLLEAVSSL